MPRSLCAPPGTLAFAASATPSPWQEGDAGPSGSARGGELDFVSLRTFNACNDFMGVCFEWRDCQSTGVLVFQL